MKYRHLFLAASLAASSVCAHAEVLRLITHSSFDLSAPVIAGFEKQTGIQLEVIKSGDAGEMLNKLILTRANPIGDVVFGLDNTLVGKAEAAGVLDPYNPASHGIKLSHSLPYGLVSTDYGYVTLNYDKSWFAKHKLPLPKTLDDLTVPAYKGLLVVENPATSSTGLSFLASTIKALGEDRAFAFWAKLRQNGLKVSNDWTDAYNTQFSRNGGAYPIVLSYGTSPAAEVFYSKTPLKTSPTENLLLPGAVFLQVEGIGLIKGGHERAAAEKFIDFMRSPAVQKDLQTTMWMLPVVDGTPIAPIYRFGLVPTVHQTPSAADIQRNAPRWIKRWIDVVLH
jgi:thiamine transport system substrate-binding protein